MMDRYQIAAARHFTMALLAMVLTVIALVALN